MASSGCKLLSRSGEIETLDIPNEFFPNRRCGFSLDIGGSLTKLVYAREEGTTVRFHFVSYPNTEMNKVISHARTAIHDSWEGDITIKTCGLRAAQFQDIYKEQLGVIFESQIEFDCFVEAFQFLHKTLPFKKLIHATDPEVTAVGIHRAKTLSSIFSSLKNATGSDVHLMSLVEDEPLLNNSSSPEDEGYTNGFSGTTEEIQFPVLFCMIGSGIGLMVIHKDKPYHIVDICNRGGRMLLGLGRALTGVETYEELLDLASQGTSVNVNSTGRMLMPKSTDPVYPCKQSDLVIYALGELSEHHASRFSKEDIAAAVVATTCNDLAEVCHTMAMLQGTKTMLYCGSVPGTSQLVREELGMETTFRGLYNCQGKRYNHHFLRFGGYYGALGALLRFMQQQ